jgi:protein-tyrosine-phosphatase
LALRPVPPTVSPSRRRRRTRVLFACTGNGARSQIAEALLQHAAGDRVDVVSGGSHPKPIDRNAISVLAERGIDISDRRSKPLAQFDGQDFDYVVTLCDKVREACPDLATRGRAIHWSIEDPSRAVGGARAIRRVFRDLAAELETRVTFLTALIDQSREEEMKNHARP